MIHAIRPIVFLLLLPFLLRAQSPVRSMPQRRLGQPPLRGHFLTDTIEIGRPFQYALVYRHAPITDVLFPDTARHFAPYLVQKVAVYATQTTGTGSAAISLDSAVYTLVSFETDAVQQLRVPIRIMNDIDCTAHWTPTDTVFLRSKLAPASLDPARSQTPKLATETELAPLQQQFNYWALAMGFLTMALAGLIVYGLFGRPIRRQWRLYQLRKRHLLFLNNYNRLTRSINSYTAVESANQAVVMWKAYLERLDSKPYTSLTTPELAARMNDEGITNALREADRMIYGGTFSPESLAALRILGEVATTTYRRRRARMLEGTIPVMSQSAETPSIS